MTINPDTGEYTGNDLERLEEALDKFLCRGPVHATWRRLRTQDSNALIPSFTIEYQNLQGYCEHVSLMADDELSPVSESKEAPEVMRLGLDVYTSNDGVAQIMTSTRVIHLDTGGKSFNEIITDPALVVVVRQWLSVMSLSVHPVTYATPGAAIILAENILTTAICKGIKQLGELQLSKENIARILWVARWCKQQLLEKDWESSDRAKLRHLEAANRDIYAAEMCQYQAILKRLENNPPYNP